jgi:hypothetical protein
MADYQNVSGAAFNIFNIRDPVAFPSREAGLRSFAIETCGRAANER